MQYTVPQQARTDAYHNVLEHYLCDETKQIERLLDIAELDETSARQIETEAADLVAKVRESAAESSGINAFMQQYDLSSQEGVTLMCLAEALLRIPDTATINRLLEDKIGGSNWQAHIGESKSWFVNASTWALMISGRMLRREDLPDYNFLKRMIRRSGEPFIRSAVSQAMRMMGHQFVVGRTIEEAVENAQRLEKRGYTYSYDMLGEAARTDEDAQRYFDDYWHAIDTCGQVSNERGPIASPGVSVKLSALHARYEIGHHQRVLNELLPRLQKLTRLAARHNVNMTIDAEETERLDLSLELLELVSADEELGDWQGLGLAVQAYQKRALDVIDWLVSLAERHNRRFMIRLVKGAYWDTEIKAAQEAGLDDYPLFTRKHNTDVSYLACAQRILANPQAFYGQFATHNAHTLAYIRHLTTNRDDFEFQRLHGMGEDLHAQIVEEGDSGTVCRIYAPVGAHEDLLPYLVRRLLENGANSSFVNQVVDENEPVEAIVADPVRAAREQNMAMHPHIPLPSLLYGQQRRNSKGVNLADVQHLEALSKQMNSTPKDIWHNGPLVNGHISESAREKLTSNKAQPVRSPADHDDIVGHVVWAEDEDVEAALAAASQAVSSWADTPARERAACLYRYANLLETHMGEMIALCTREAGKNIDDGVAEVREAVDFCRYYAAQAENEFDEPHELPDSAHTSQKYWLRGRGVFVTVCPWNFPVAIFTGQTVAALVAGNAVIAKPAEQSSLIGLRAVQLMHEAGIPTNVLHCLPGAGDIGAKLVSDSRVAGVAFTGSLATAQTINQTLAERDGPIIPLIAETGGQNAMIVDSSALLEQVVPDIIRSGFQSAGQRCSALRVLYVQDDIADNLIHMLSGAMAELAIDDPWKLGTDVTPVIDAKAQQKLADYAGQADRKFKNLYTCQLGDHTQNGTYIAPRIYEISSTSDLGDEQFGPIVHIIRFSADEIDQVVDTINDLGYGLTFGIHSRIDLTVERVLKRLRIGNMYVNRNIIGAVVGVQPFGGEGLSGTGPKAGGPKYLYRFVDTVASTREASNTPRFDIADIQPEKESPDNWREGALTSGALTQSARKELADNQKQIAQGNQGTGQVVPKNATDLEEALEKATRAKPRWASTVASERAVFLRNLVEQLTQHAGELMALCQHEAGQGQAQTSDEISKAIEFCHYYAVQAEEEFDGMHTLPGPTGERNTYGLFGRGLFVVIGSNVHPLATMAGQIAAALVAGNTVIAKPGEQASLVAARLVRLMHEVGIPDDVLHCLPGDDNLGARLIQDPRVDGVAFAGAQSTAKHIHQQLASREGPIIPLIAETGNHGPMMLVESALYRFATERVVSNDTTAAGGNASLMSLEEDEPEENKLVTPEPQRYG